MISVSGFPKINLRWRLLLKFACASHHSPPTHDIGEKRIVNMCQLPPDWLNIPHMRRCELACRSSVGQGLRRDSSTDPPPTSVVQHTVCLASRLIAHRRKPNGRPARTFAFVCASISRAGSASGPFNLLLFSFQGHKQFSHPPSCMREKKHFCAAARLTKVKILLPSWTFYCLKKNTSAPFDMPCVILVKFWFLSQTNNL